MPFSEVVEMHIFTITEMQGVIKCRWLKQISVAITWNSRKSNQALEGKIRGVKNLFMIMKIGLTNYNFMIGLASQKKKKKTSSKLASFNNEWDFFKWAVHIFHAGTR